MPETLPVLLLLTPFLAGLACLLPGFTAEVVPLSTAAALLLVIFAFLVVRQVVFGAGGVAVHRIVLVDALNSVPIFVIAIAGAVSILCSRPLSHDATLRAPAYYSMLHFLICALLLAAMASNLGLLWLALAVGALLGARLTGFGEDQPGRDAMHRQMALHGTGLAFAVFALLLVYAAGTAVPSATPAALDWPALHRAAGRLDATLMRLAFAFAVLGFGSIAGLLMPRIWLPDTLRTMPAPAGALWLAGLPCCAIYALLRCQALTVQAVGAAFPAHLLIGAGLLALAGAAIAILVERDLIRIASYAAAGQAGAIVTAAGIGGREATFGALLLLVGYGCMACVAAVAAGALCRPFSTSSLARLHGSARELPVPGGLLVGALLAACGLPPTAAFLGIFSALDGAFRQGLAAAGVALVLALTLLCTGLVRQSTRLLLALPGRHPRQGLNRSPAAVWPLALPVGVALLFGVHLPDQCAAVLQTAADIARGAR